VEESSVGLAQRTQEYAPYPGRHKTLLNTRKPFIVVATRGQRTVISLQSFEHISHIGTVNARYFLNAYFLRVRKATSSL